MTMKTEIELLREQNAALREQNAALLIFVASFGTALAVILFASL